VVPESKITGIDIDPGVRQKAPAHLQDRIIVGDLLETRFDAPFDIITMEMVIEHLPDPAAFLRKCSDLLAPGGVLTVSTPNIDSKPAQETGPN